MSRADGTRTAPELLHLQLDGEALPQLTELLLQGWLVVERTTSGWTLERLRTDPLAPPSSRAGTAGGRR